MHTVIDLSAGMSWHESDALEFCLQALGIMAEDGMKSAWRYLKGSKSARGPVFAVRLVGYLWVVLWLVWSTPISMFPVYRVREGHPGKQPLLFQILAISRPETCLLTV